MKSSTRCLAVLFCALICLPVEANDLVDQHFEAIGGRDRVAKVKTIFRSGKVDGDGALGKVTGTFEEAADLVKLLGHASTDLLIDGFAHTRQLGWSKGSAWLEDSQSGVGDLPAAEARVIAYQYSPSPLATIALTDPAAEVKAAGEAEFDGAKCDVLTVKGRSERFYVNQESHLLQGMSVPGLMNVTLGDYAPVDGVQIPNKRTIEITGVGVILNFTFEKTELNRPIDPKLIEKPNQSNAKPNHGNAKPNRPERPQSDNGMTAQDIIASLDKNDDEQIDLEEYILANGSVPAGEVLEKFKSLDVNRDNLIGVSEADAMAEYANKQKGGSAKQSKEPAVVTAQQLVEAMG